MGSFYFPTFFLFIFLLFTTCGVKAQQSSSELAPSRLMQDLLTVNYWDQRLNEKFPVTYDHLLQGGYFNMPSARMAAEGVIGIGYAWVPPYYQYNLKLQLIDFLEVSGSYRIFKGIDDPILTPLGFGDYSDKGANLKLALFKPEDSHYQIPGLAIGLEDFMGTSSFKAYYAVLTQVFLNYHLEVSIGYGAKRIRGWFGGVNWMPFRSSSYSWLQNLSLTCEYDAIPYHDKEIEKHPKGRRQRTPFNIGIKYHLWDLLDLSFSYIRGDQFAFSVASSYNFGMTEGLIPKYESVLPYRAPVNLQELGIVRPEDVMVQELQFAMNSQGLDMTKALIGNPQGCKTLRLHVANLAYREEQNFKERVVAILAALVPQDIELVIIVVDAFLVDVQQYHFCMPMVRRYKNKKMGKFEFNLLTAYKEVSTPCQGEFRTIFCKQKERVNFELMPRTQTLFGSSRGKFKYAAGLTFAVNGFFKGDVFYSVQLGKFFLSDFDQVKDVDRLNPSQLINVRSDVVRYYQQTSFTLDEAYLEKVWNLGKGWYSRIAMGYFEIEYAGTAFECLYSPAKSNWAVGIDCAILKKRAYKGWGFTNRVRKLDGFVPHWLPFTGSQGFLNIYYNWTCADIELKLSLGKFLANDCGARFEVSRYFQSGMRVGFWYTLTNGNDRINDQTYYDKGIFFSVPLDIFYSRSSRSRWGYGMSAWLRDVGVKAANGSELYNLIYLQRQ